MGIVPWATGKTSATLSSDNVTSANNARRHALLTWRSFMVMMGDKELRTYKTLPCLKASSGELSHPAVGSNNILDLVRVHSCMCPGTEYQRQTRSG